MSDIKFCFRYEKVKENLESDIKKLLKRNGFFIEDNIECISMKGGGICKKKLKEVIIGKD